MARKKNGKKRSFIFHDLWFEIIHALDAESTYELLMAIEKHHKGQEVELTNPVLLPSFMMIKAMMDEDNASYQETCEKRKKVATEAWEERKKKSANDADIENEEPEEVETSDKEKVPYKEIIELYNSICVSLPAVTRVTEGRRKAIRSRYKEYGMDGIRKVFEAAEASDFLSGRNGKWSNCGYDWIMKPTNFLKIFEGNYSAEGGEKNGTSSSRYTEDEINKIFADDII